MLRRRIRNRHNPTLQGRPAGSAKKPSQPGRLWGGGRERGPGATGSVGKPVAPRASTYVTYRANLRPPEVRMVRKVRPTLIGLVLALTVLGAGCGSSQPSAVSSPNKAESHPTTTTLPDDEFGKFVIQCHDCRTVMPNVVGESEAKAASVLRRLGLHPRTMGPTGGTVQSQQPVADTKIPDGSTVLIVTAS
jgi:hypothetical protein